MTNGIVIISAAIAVSATITIPTAVAIKIQIGAASSLYEELTMEIQGREQVSGLPKSMSISTSEVIEAIQEPLAMIVGVAKKVLADTPPELASDIIDRGIVLTGGLALLRGMEQYVTHATGVPAYRSDEPIMAVALGAVRALNNPSLMRSMLQTI